MNIAENKQAEAMPRDFASLSLAPQCGVSDLSYRCWLIAAAPTIFGSVRVGREMCPH